MWNVINLAEVKKYRAVDSAHDVLVSNLVASAHDYIRVYCNLAADTSTATGAWPQDLRLAQVELILMAYDKADKHLLGVSSRAIAGGDITNLQLDWPGRQGKILDRHRIRKIG